MVHTSNGLTGAGSAEGIDPVPSDQVPRCRIVTFSAVDRNDKDEDDVEMDSLECDLNLQMIVPIVTITISPSNS